MDAPAGAAFLNLTQRRTTSPDLGGSSGTLADGYLDHVVTERPGVPKYVQLAELIRQRIMDGTYQVGIRLPSEQYFVEETGYGRDTVRAAMKVLRETGWITVTHGLGTFVNPPEDRSG